MTSRRCVAAMAPLIGAVWGCGASTEQSIDVTAIAPPIAFNDVAFRVSITGSWFRPVYHFDTMAAETQAESGAFSAALAPVGGADADAVPLEGVTWLSPEEIKATVPAGLPAGNYDVVLTDPRGAQARMEGGFVSLGPDTEKPTVSLERPSARTLIAAGTTVAIAVSANDGDGFLSSLGARIDAGPTGIELVCPVAPARHDARCEYSFVAPAPAGPDATVVITVHATDTAGNDADATPATFRLVSRPTLVSISPASGPAAGGTEVVVQGVDFAVPTVPSEGSRLLLDGVAIMPTTFSPTEIRATLPRHDPGIALISVANGDAETTDKLPFEFIGAPVAKLVAPLKGPVTGGTRISISGNNFREGDTTIMIGDFELVSPDYSKAPLRIDGYIPAGTAPGPVWIVVTDTRFDSSNRYPDPFVYEPAATDPPDGGVDPVGFAGGP